MKIRNYLTILFAVLCIAVLIGLAGFMTLYTADDSNPLRQQMMEILHLEAPAADAPISQPTESSSEFSTELATAKEHSLLFVGDSRTVGMGKALNDSCSYIGESGEGYYWFVETGMHQLTSIIEGGSTQPVIFNFGVNDPENISLYIDCYRSLMDSYPNTSFYILSVNPLEKDTDFNTTNEMVELFNATMQGAFPEIYLDCYSYLIEHGFKTVDGLHYTEDSYRTIHDFTVDMIA